MNKKFILAAVLGVLMVVTSCYKDPETQPELPMISIDKTSLEPFAFAAGASQQVTLTVNRDWSIQCDADWLSFDPESGHVQAGENTKVVVTVTALTNDVGNMRKATVRFKTSAKYADLSVQQEFDPDAAPTLLYYNAFGKDLAGLDNPLVTATDLWRCEEGSAVNALAYYKTSGDLSVRNSSTSNSSAGAGSECYDGASGNNHLFFGSDAPSLTIGDIPVHKKLSMLEFSFGVFHIDGQKVPESDFLVYVSNDSENWVPLEYDVVSEYSEPKWCFCKAEIAFEMASFDMLYLKFAPKTASKYRVDDIRISSDPSYGQTPASEWIDWSKGAVSLKPGTVIE